MDILVQKPIFCPSSRKFYESPPCDYFAPYNTPPYITTHLHPHSAPGTETGTGSGTGNWLGEQMQYLRFPTPPTTPPRIVVPISVPVPIESRCSSRTQSVIMKCSKSSSSGSGSRSPTESCSEQSSGSECDFICNWQDCGRVFESLEALAQHVTLRHAIASLLDGLYYCRWAGCQRSERGFNARYKMLVHVRTHTKEKPHRCHLCEKSFSRAENLKIHIRSHSGEKPYKCHFEGCQKAYSNSSDRFKHTRTHSMEKPYMCKVPGCQKRYTDPSSLRKHVKTFKHSIQLIASQSSTCLLDATEHSCLPLTAPVSVSVPLSTSCVESSPSSRCYDSDNMASDYSLRAKHHNEYTSSDYWPLHPREHSYRYLHSEDFAMDMDLDTPTPLDLRIHRS